MTPPQISIGAIYRQVATDLSAPCGIPASASGSLHLPLTMTEPDSRSGWVMVKLDNLTAASDLLDLIENLGIQDSELMILGEQDFVVRWRCRS